MQGGIVSHVIYSIFILILVFLVVTNWPGMVAIMSTGSSSGVPVIKALQGR